MHGEVSASARRERVVGYTALTILALIAWWLTVTQARGMWWMPGTMGMGLVPFLAMWIVMMVAMMLPATTPVVTIWGRLVASQSRGIRRYARMTVFLCAYLVAWSVIGVVAWAMLRAVEATLPKSAFTSGAVAAVTLATAGVYQLTRLKHACLDHCRSPVTLLAHFRGRDGPFTDFRIGFLHGGYCVGCCAGLMLVLIGVGLMNVPAMVVLTVLIFAEKLAPRGPIVARASGVVFLVAALVVWMWRPS